MSSPLVLVADDDVFVRLDVAEVLESAGFSIIQAGDAAGALALLRQTTAIQLVCTDIHMPGDLDGVDLVLTMREHHPHVKVVVVSSDAGCRGRLPGVEFLSKPFLPSRLVEAVRGQIVGFA